MIVAALILSGTFILCMHFLKDTAKGDEKTSPSAENKTTYNIYNTNSHNTNVNSHNSTSSTNTNTTNEDNVSEKMVKQELQKLREEIIQKEKALSDMLKELNKINND